jgi:hypothetical protein
MTIRVEFLEQGVRAYQPWPEAEHAPAVDDLVDLMPMDGSTVDDEVVATVRYRQWYENGRAVTCYVGTR